MHLRWIKTQSGTPCKNKYKKKKLVSRRRRKAVQKVHNKTQTNQNGLLANKKS